MRRFIFAVVAISAAVVVTLLTTAANQQPYYREPAGSTMILWDSRTDQQTPVPRPDNSSVAGFIKRFDKKMDAADLASNSAVDLASYDIVMVHPSALSNLSPTMLERLRSHIDRGKVLIWMSGNPTEFLSKLGDVGFGFKPTPNSTTAIVGLGIKDEGGLLPRFMVIGVDPDRLRNEGPHVALNGLIGGANELLNPVARPDFR